VASADNGNGGWEITDDEAEDSVVRASPTAQPTAEKHVSGGLPHLPFELWNMMLGFLRHTALPMQPVGWVPTNDYETDDSEVSDDDDADDMEGYGE
jgi:hypothetical protein